MAHLLGYARVSITDQNPELQVDALRAAGCYRIFVDKGQRNDDRSAGTRPDPRPAPPRRHPRRLETRIASDDPYGTSWTPVAGLHEQGIGFHSLQESIDTTTPSGKLIFHVFAALAEFERDLIVERAQAGLAAARARGRVGGRPAVMTPQKLAVARHMYDSHEYTVAAIAKTLGVSQASIYRHLSRTTALQALPSKVRS